MTTRVWMVATPGVLLLDLAGPAEAFRLAQRAGAPLELHLCGPTPQVETSLGVPLSALVAQAERLLQDERMTVEHAAELAGFGSARDLRRAWRRHAAGTPSGK